MWERQLGRLHSILRQLESAVAKDILQNLEQAQSQYASSFNHVRKDVNKVVRETNRILSFLSTMKWLLDELHQAVESKQMLKLFKPLMQVLFLVWSNSVYYHQMDKFNNILKLMSNELVHRAIALVGEDILREPLESYSKLKEALRVCAGFRGTYLDFKDKADDQNSRNIAENAERLASRPQAGTIFLTKMYGLHAFTPRYGLRMNEGHSSSGSLNEDDLWTDSPWPPRNAPCFDLLNSLMERCNDILELVETTRHFRLLAGAADIGGAGNMSLDALVKEIHEKYTQAMSDFFSVVDNVLSIDGSQNFERAFFRFRTIVKSLEKRLAEILRLSYNQCPTVEAQLRLLEVFEGVSGRELVQIHLEDKDRALVTAFNAELNNVRQMYAEGHMDPPQHANMPPVVSKLIWVNALKERIQRPMDKMKVSPHSLEGDMGWQMRDNYTEVYRELEEFQHSAAKEWLSNITAELTIRLKQPLLIAEEFDDEIEVRPQVIHVNLDPQFLLLLKETHYLKQDPFNIKLPESAKELLRNTKAFELRVTATRRETIVSKYNAIMRTMTQFEKPLFERKLAKIDILFEQGLQDFTWKMKESADFIEQAMALVCLDVHQNLDVVQTNSHEIAEITISWSKGKLDVFSAHEQMMSYSMEQLLGMQARLNEEHESVVVPSGIKIHSLVANSFEGVQISQASPAWQDFIDYIDAIVLDGLKQATLTSLKTMLNNLVQANMVEENDTIIPILTIRLELIDNRVAFRPPLDQNTSAVSVQELVHQWLDGFLARGRLVKMLGPKGTYQDYISADEEVKQLLMDITKLVEENSDECKKLLEIFSDYAFLWLQDVNITFDEFLRGNLTPNPQN